VTGPERLRADCANCFGLCCVALPFSRSADFAIDKPAGRPCPHLQRDFACDIHDRLRPAGFPGCTVYDCFGAGQQIAQVTFGGRDWRTHPEVAAPMFEAFSVMRRLHEMMWYLGEAMTWPAAHPLHDELHHARSATEVAAAGGPDALAGLDVDALRIDVAPLLRHASALVRGPGRPDHAGADLIGADLRRIELRGADLRGAYLIAADLRGVDLREADLLGADLRDADVRGADLSSALFLTRPQLSATNGDDTTRIPATLDRPARWPPNHR
jgi:uncharacterized protein YjbI with pentapeptide repeats